MQVIHNTSPRRMVAIGGSGLALLLLALVAWYALSLRDQMRQAQVAARGAQVMPFDLERTSHIFTAHPDGGVQQVIADDPQDAEQIELIRSHLQEEATRFRQGDFGDPAAIHGDAMPGLAELRRGFAGIDVAYSELPDGAQLRYTASDPALMAALHTWFRAQLSDHGDHASEHGGHTK